MVGPHTHHNYEIRARRLASCTNPSGNPYVGGALLFTGAMTLAASVSQKYGRTEISGIGDELLAVYEHGILAGVNRQYAEYFRGIPLFDSTPGGQWRMFTVTGSKLDTGLYLWYT